MYSTGSMYNKLTALIIGHNVSNSRKKSVIFALAFLVFPMKRDIRCTLFLSFI